MLLYLLADDGVFVAGAVVRAVLKAAADELGGLILVKVHIADIEAVLIVVLVIQAVFAF